MSWVAVGVGGAALVGGVASAALSGGDEGGGIPMATKKLQNRAIINQEVGAARAGIENELFKEQSVQMDRARIGLLGALGAPGTYEESYEDFVAGGGGPGVGAPQGLFNLVEISKPGETAPISALPGKGGGIYTKEEQKAQKMFEKTGGLIGDDYPNRTQATGSGWILDPDKYMEYMKGTRQFRMVSRMTAEADQLVRQEGPLWEKLRQSVENPILQGAATSAREMQETLAREAARGGSARNRAVQVANQIAANNDILGRRANALWTSSLAVKQWTQDNALRQLSFNQSWVSNLGGIRDVFAGFMQDAQNFYGSQILPSVVNASGQTMNAASNNASVAAQMAQMQAQRDQQMSNLISGVGQVVVGGGLTAASYGGWGKA